MDIGPELPPFIAEPLEDPFRRETLPEPAPPEPEQAPEPEPVRTALVVEQTGCSA